MEENRLKAHLKKLKEILAPMTWQERMEHLWTYYKWVLIAVVVIGILLHIIISSAIAANTQILISGISINVPVTDEGVTCLSDGYLARLEGKKGQTVQLIEEVLDMENPMLNQEASYSAIVRVSGMITTDSLDYLLLDQKALDYYSTGDLFLDLRQVFTDEELAQLNVTEIGTTPMLIDLAGTWFADTHITGDGPYYLAFIHNTSRTAQCHDLWYYLQSGN